MGARMQVKIWDVSFIQETDLLNDKDERRLALHMRNWLTVNAHMGTLQNDWASVLELKKMLQYEIANANRRDIVHRLYMRMNSIRRALELRELEACR